MSRITRSCLLGLAIAATPAMALAQAAPGAAANAASKAPQASSAPTGVSQGATVFDTSGNIVGTIESADNQFATLATTKSKVRLPLSSFAAGPKGPLLGMTAAQVDAAAGSAKPAGASASAAASAPAASATTSTTTGGMASAAPAGPAASAAPPVAKGMQVRDSAGVEIGTIEAVDSQFATVATSKTKVRLPLTAFATDAKGARIGMTAAQLDAAAGAAAATPANGSAKGS